MKRKNRIYGFKDFFISKAMILCSILIAYISWYCAILTKPSKFGNANDTTFDIGNTGFFIQKHHLITNAQLKLSELLKENLKFYVKYPKKL